MKNLKVFINKFRNNFILKSPTIYLKPINQYVTYVDIDFDFRYQVDGTGSGGTRNGKRNDLILFGNDKDILFEIIFQHESKSFCSIHGNMSKKTWHGIVIEDTFFRAKKNKAVIFKPKVRYKTIKENK